MTGSPDNTQLARRNSRVLLMSLGVVVAMVGLSFAAVPLYQLFCQVTGFGGTTQVAEAMPDQVLDRTMRVRFVATADPALPWAFDAETREMEVRIGEPGLAFYSATNTAEQPTAGMAVYNVTPAKAGLYFSKVQCFCFDEQILSPGAEVDFPVYFFLDPAMADDPNLDDVQVVTLSYTFYASESDALERAVDDYYEGIEGLSAAEPRNDITTAGLGPTADAANGGSLE